MLFSWKRRRTDPPPTLARINPLPSSERDWSAFENAEAWPSIKVWLPSDVGAMLDGLASYRNQSRSEVMRDLLFIGLYGHYTYAQLVAERRGLPRGPGRLESGEYVVFDLPRAPQPDEPPSPRPRKNTVNVRLFLPAPMQTDLEALAQRENVTVSEFARQLIHRMLLGPMP